jgi:hypothetical protein
MYLSRVSGKPTDPSKVIVTILGRTCRAGLSQIDYLLEHRGILREWRVYELLGWWNAFRYRTDERIVL